MIRTLIEITSENPWQHERDLREALDKLGFEPKPNSDHTRFMDDLYRELHDRGLEPMKLVAAYRSKRDDAA